MNGKKSFILYADLISVVEKLPDQKAGVLFKIILDYVNDKNPKVKDLLLQIAFEPIKLQLKRDLMNWNEIRTERVKAGQLGGIKSGETRRKQKEANEASALKLKQKEANEAVTVNVTVTETVTEDLKPDLQSGSFTFEDKYKYFIELFNRVAKETSSIERSFRGDIKSKTQFKARLKEGYTSQDFAKAVKNLYSNQHHRDNGFNHATPELITRSEKFVMYLNAKY